MLHAAETVNNLDASQRNTNADSSSSFISINSSDSQSVSSKTQFEIESAIKFTPSLTLGYPTERNPYKANDKPEKVMDPGIWHWTARSWK